MSTDAKLDAPKELARLIVHQPGSIVSHALLKEEGGSVIAFAFEAGEGLSEHTSPCEVLLYAIEGGATVTVNEASHVIGAGRIMRLPAKVPHSVHADERFKMLLVMIRMG